MPTRRGNSSQIWPVNVPVHRQHHGVVIGEQTGGRGHACADSPRRQRRSCCPVISRMLSSLSPPRSREDEHCGCCTLSHSLLPPYSRDTGASELERMWACLRRLIISHGSICFSIHCGCAAFFYPVTVLVWVVDANSIFWTGCWLMPSPLTANTEARHSRKH